MIANIVKKILFFFKRDEKSKSEGARSNLQKNFLKDSSGNQQPNDFIDRKNQSMKDSQGKSDFSGSSYNGPGNVDREKRNSNMSQRNF